jgi:UDP-2,3-diacylglucosamine pyrophosphatase LpxH|tara:strand:+ start:5428 stop:5730 length:303 start_codon:yes stop_codon:yes gene_type:complete
MNDKDKIIRSELAREFLKSRFWAEHLHPWVESERTRLAHSNMALPDTEKFHRQREDNKSRWTACGIIEQIAKEWATDEELIKRSKEMQIADKSMMGGKNK